MCTVCGLPTTHSNLTQILGLATLFSFALTTFIGAWWVVTTFRIQKVLQRVWKSFSLRLKLRTLHPERRFSKKMDDTENGSELL